MLNSTTGAPEVILYFRNNSDHSDGYVQAFTPYYHDITLAKHQHGGSAWEEIVVRDYSFKFSEWYQVKVQADRSRLQVYVDNELVIDTVEFQLNSGSLSFQVGPGAHVLIDNIRVQELGK